MTDTNPPPADEDVMTDAEAGRADADLPGGASEGSADETGAPLDPAQAIEALQTEASQLRAQLQRAMADYQNLQRRSREERLEVGRFALGDAIRSLLPVLDDLERAVDAAEREAETGSWLEGIRLVVQKFRGTLEQHGVEEIHALGQPFDPNQHEAVGAAAGPDGQVIHVLQRGYTLRERVIRPAMVMVGNGEDAPGAAPTR